VARELRARTAPTGAAVVRDLLPAVAAALEGEGPALAPLPTGGSRRSVLDAIRPDEPLEREDVALVVATSGSTGEPKAALLPAGALQHSARATHDRLGGPGQWLLALPVTHVAGLTVLVRSLVARRRPVVLDLYGGFDVSAFVAAAAAMDADSRRYTALVPTQLHRLLAAGVDLTGFDAILVGGASLSDELAERAGAAGARVVTTYGSTETCGGCVYDGVPLGGVAVDVDADGRVRVSGPVLFAGYRLRPELTAEVLVDDRFRTSDLGRFDDDGRLHVLGRADDVVVTGGENVPAAVVERAIAGHPAVAAVAVVGRPDPEWGQRVVAVVQPADPTAPPTVDDLREHARDRLPAAALPREVVVVGLLPTLPTGKPDKAAVRTLVARPSR
jgi:O-succinylbenzoic acid--CoA ligase